MTGHQSFYIKFFTISPEYNDDSGICIKAYHFITINSSEESRFQVNDSKRKKGILWQTINKGNESIGNKDSAWKNDISKAKELLSPLCNK